MIFKKKSYYDEMPETETINGDTPGQAQQEIPAEPAPASVASTGPAESGQHGKEDGSMNESDLTASISKNTVVKGDVATKDNLEIFGHVEGDVISKAVVKVYGVVRGKICCETFVASGAKICGDITCTHSVVVRTNTEIEGDIKCGSASISGAILGNVIAGEMVSLSETASVTGNVIAAGIEVSKGAILNGSVETQKKEPPKPVEKAKAVEQKEKTETKMEPKTETKTGPDAAPSVEKPAGEAQKTEEKIPATTANGSI